MLLDATQITLQSIISSSKCLICRSSFRCYQLEQYQENPLIPRAHSTAMDDGQELILEIVANLGSAACPYACFKPPS